MPINRRRFLKAGSAAFAMGSFGMLPAISWAETAEPSYIKICILHTNDWHSRIEPFPMDGSKWQGTGGAAHRASLIQAIRKEEKNVLLLDAGDVFQGTPYFNYYHGELEFKLMSYMGYDAATLGNHDFDAGLEGLYKQLPNATFPFLTANYDFSQTMLKNAFAPYKIFIKEGVKIGVFAVNIELQGLVPDANYGLTKYQEPVQIALETATLLKQQEHCDLVICLSHLGYKYDDQKVSDVVLARNTRHIDLIIGGHTHTFMETPDVQKNLDQEDVWINQVGWAGINIGRIDFYLTKSKLKNKMKAHTVIVSNKQEKK
jgi:5'-nucleotidase